MNNRDAYDYMISEIKKNEPACSIGLIGSLAGRFEEKIHDCRDVDIMVIRSDHSGFEREIRMFNDLEFDISYICIGDLNYQVQERSNIWVKAILDYTEVDNALGTSYGKEIEGIKELAARICKGEGPEVPEVEIKFIRYNLTNKLAYLENAKGDPLKFNYLSHDYLGELIRYYFVLRERAVPKVKKHLKEIMKLDPELYCDIERFYGLQVPSEKYEHLMEMTAYALQDFGGFLKYWEKGKYPIDR